MKIGYEIKRIQQTTILGKQLRYSNTEMDGVFTHHKSNVDIFQFADITHPLINEFKNKLNNKTYKLFPFPCIICNSNEFTNVAQSNEGFVWGICKNCGLLQIYKRLGKDDLDDFYRTGEYQAICMGNLDDKTHMLLEYNVMSLYFINIFNSLKMQPRDTSIIEIGCGSGGILRALKEWGAKAVKGYDIDQHRVDYGKNTIEEIAVGDALSLDPTVFLGFNVVLLSNVLEHLSNPYEFLFKITSLITSPNVRIVIDIPNLEYCYGYSNTSFLKFLHIAHLWYFNSITIERLLNQVGLGVDHIFPGEAGLTVICSKRFGPINNFNNAYWNSVSSINYANFCNAPNNVGVKAKREMEKIYSIMK